MINMVFFVFNTTKKDWQFFVDRSPKTFESAFLSFCNSNKSKSRLLAPMGLPLPNQQVNVILVIIIILVSLYGFFVSVSDQDMFVLWIVISFPEQDFDFEIFGCGPLPNQQLGIFLFGHLFIVQVVFIKLHCVDDWFLLLFIYVYGMLRKTCLNYYIPCSSAFFCLGSAVRVIFYIIQSTYMDIVYLYITTKI